jgi:ABC-type uncharacterized transport system permease subunit
MKSRVSFFFYSASLRHVISRRVSFFLLRCEGGTVRFLFILPYSSVYIFFSFSPHLFVIFSAHHQKVERERADDCIRLLKEEGRVIIYCSSFTLNRRFIIRVCWLLLCRAHDVIIASARELLSILLSSFLSFLRRRIVCAI